jgi:hypothetical protein
VISRQDRVQVWASRLLANDFPPVCAMSGRPAETWRRFSFVTPPAWAYWLLLLICAGGLGFIAYAIAIAAVAERASGYLPLTRSSSRTVTLAFWVPTGLLIAWVAAWALTVILAWTTTDPNVTTIAWVSFGLGFLFLGAGLAGRLLVSPFIRPQGKVRPMAPGQNDRIVELRNVHPNFVRAVNQVQPSRVAPSLQVPTLPGSN